MTEREIAEVIGKLELLESWGIAPQVSVPVGKFEAIIVETSQLEAAGIPKPHYPGSFSDVRRARDELRKMHKDAREREILIEAWERFREGEGGLRGQRNESTGL